MGSAIALPVAPARTATGSELPVGVYLVVGLAGGGYTVRRSIASTNWYPLNADGSWKSWPDWYSCDAECCPDGDNFDVDHLMHWGTGRVA